MSSTILYKVGPKKVGIRGEQLKYVARPFYAPKLSEKDIIDRIRDNYMGITRGMIHSVLDAVVNEFHNQLFNGHPVKLTGLGTFRISFNSEAHDTPDTLTADAIHNPRIIFVPDISLRREVKDGIVFEEIGKQSV